MSEEGQEDTASLTSSEQEPEPQMVDEGSEGEVGWLLKAICLFVKMVLRRIYHGSTKSGLGTINLEGSDLNFFFT